MLPHSRSLHISYHWLTQPANSFSRPFSVVSCCCNILLPLAAPVLVQRSRYMAGLTEAYFLLVMAPVFPLQETADDWYGNDLASFYPPTTGSLPPFTRFGCLLIAAAENTHYSRVSSKEMVELSMSWITSRVFGLSSILIPCCSRRSIQLLPIGSRGAGAGGWWEPNSH